MKLSIIVPAYNEGRTIESILNKLVQVVLINNLNKEIIVVNDFSTDNTEEQVLSFKNKNYRY